MFVLRFLRHNKDMMSQRRKRRVILMVILLIFLIIALVVNFPKATQPKKSSVVKNTPESSSLAIEALKSLAVKGRAPKTGYSRAQFGDGWAISGGCDTRNKILYRDLIDAKVDKKCSVNSGILNDPYTGKTINFVRGSKTSGAVQIDHVVALSDAWQKGAQKLSLERRTELANDPLELLAVDGQANQQKSDGDAATWLPPNKAFRCQYVARQVAVKQKYVLWVTRAEFNVISTILSGCAGQRLPNL